jgi:nitrite reductase/ring-hydroxylating ferredoxin subunit
MDANFIKAIKVSDFANRTFKCFRFKTKPIGIFKKEDGSFVAMEVACKHQNANLMTGKIAGDIVTCPRHGWKYNLKNGDCLTEPWAYLRYFRTKVEEDYILIDPQPIERDL